VLLLDHSPLLEVLQHQFGYQPALVLGTQLLAVVTTIASARNLAWHNLLAFLATFVWAQEAVSVLVADALRPFLCNQVLEATERL